ncbi:MAG: T9SS type A sorting domain-containing protein [Flavobacteriales bacterium]|nr:T9SS type A sorting domain-containing protein [Flavobacteriales bacterium]
MASALLTGKTGLLVVPNPVTASATLFLDTPLQGQITLRTMDASGRMVHELRKVNNVGEIRLEFPVATLEPGSYFLQVLDAKGEVVGRVPFVRQ